MISPKQFWKKLKNSVLSKKTSSPIELSSELGRYLTSSGHFAKTLGKVKHGAFMPNPDGELSVFYLTGKEEKERIKISKAYIFPKLPHGRSIYGYAENIVQDFKNAKLEVNKFEPPPDHFNIEGWPESKDEQMFIAQELAENASLKLFHQKLTKG